MGAIRFAVSNGHQIYPKAPYLKVRFEDPDYLSAGRPEDRDGFDWQVFGLEAQLGGGERRDHGR